jgi:hypothetical protein
MSALFLGHPQILELQEKAERARALVRRAERFTTKSESKTGMDAHRSLHEAEGLIDQVLTILKGG